MRPGRFHREGPCGTARIWGERTGQAADSDPLVPGEAGKGNKDPEVILDCRKLVTESGSQECMLTALTIITMS